MPRIWEDLFNDEDRALYQAAGYGGRAEGGQRPALLVIDVTNDFVGDRPEPILKSIERFPNSCGEVGWRGMEAIADLLRVCRADGLPVFYTRNVRQRTALTRGAWGWKKTNEQTRGEWSARVGNEIPEPIAPLPDELLIEKTKPSAFFGTPLVSYLVALQVDTLLVTGTTTSGCVRASVIDAFSNNFRTLIVEEAVFDRSQTAHKANLFDMHQKYASVIPLAEALGYLRSLQPATVS